MLISNLLLYLQIHLGHILHQYILIYFIFSDDMILYYTDASSFFKLAPSWWVISCHWHCFHEDPIKVCCTVLLWEKFLAVWWLDHRVCPSGWNAGCCQLPPKMLGLLYTPTNSVQRACCPVHSPILDNIILILTTLTGGFFLIFVAIEVSGDQRMPVLLLNPIPLIHFSNNF